MADNPRIEELRRRVEADPASIAFAQLAEEYRRAGSFDEAVRVCRAGLERHPSYLSARVTLGRALIELRQYEDARAELEYVLRSAPENLAAIRGLAETHQRRGDLNEALRQYQIALAIARHDPELEESVHDLSRQLGNPPPPVQAAEPPRPAIDLPDPPDLPVSSAQPAPEDRERGASATSLSPELEAAADEFTRALQALGALTVDLPDATQVDSASPAAAEIASFEIVDTEEHQPAVAADVASPAASAGPDEGPRGESVAQIVNELEAWLDAIVLDRSERRSHRSHSQGDLGDVGAGRDSGLQGDLGDLGAGHDPRPGRSAT